MAYTNAVRSKWIFETPAHHRNFTKVLDDFLSYLDSNTCLLSFAYQSSFSTTYHGSNSLLQASTLSCRSLKGSLMATTPSCITLIVTLSLDDLSFFLCVYLYILSKSLNGGRFYLWVLYDWSPEQRTTKHMFQKLTKIWDSVTINFHKMGVLVTCFIILYGFGFILVWNNKWLI